MFLSLSFFFIVCLTCQAQYFTAIFAKCVFEGDSKPILIHGIPCLSQTTGIALKPFHFSSKRLPSVLLTVSYDIKRMFHDASAVVSL